MADASLDKESCFLCPHEEEWAAFWEESLAFTDFSPQDDAACFFVDCPHLAAFGGFAEDVDSCVHDEEEGVDVEDVLCCLDEEKSEDGEARFHGDFVDVFGDEGVADVGRFFQDEEVAVVVEVEAVVCCTLASTEEKSEDGGARFHEDFVDLR